MLDSHSANRHPKNPKSKMTAYGVTLIASGWSPVAPKVMLK